MAVEILECVSVLVGFCGFALVSAAWPGNLEEGKCIWYTGAVTPLQIQFYRGEMRVAAVTKPLQAVTGLAVIPLGDTGPTYSCDLLLPGSCLSKSPKKISLFLLPERFRMVICQTTTLTLRA